MKIKVFSICLLLATFISGFIKAQTRADSFFKEGDKVNFIGNSITHSGDYHHYVLAYYATRFPNTKVTFINSGIRGDNANSFLKRMEGDILPKKANWSVVMAGMNDVNRGLYDPANQTPDSDTRKARALSDYKGYYESVIQRLQKSGSKIILQKPTIYDQTGDLPATNLVGVNDALKTCAGIIDGFAKKYNLMVIDYFGIMNDINKQVQEKDPKATIIGNDRVHPGPVGNMIMAYQFLRSTEAPQLVSSVEIENGALKETKYCILNNLSVRKGIIRFKLKEESLPFPVPSEAEPALSLVPFSDELNMQLLKVAGLAEGIYTLTIDGISIGNFSEREFAAGLNLAKYKNTPQYKQALNVMQHALQYRNIQRKLRDIKFVEFSYVPENLWKAGLPELQKFSGDYLSVLQVTNEKKYQELKSLFENYLELKPNQADLEREAAALPGLIYSVNKPTEYAFLIKKAELAMPDQDIGVLLPVDR